MSTEKTECVGDIKDAIIAKFKQLENAKADQLQLFKLDGSNDTQLEPVQTLSEVGIQTGTMLLVKAAEPVQTLSELGIRTGTTLLVKAAAPGVCISD